MPALNPSPISDLPAMPADDGVMPLAGFDRLVLAGADAMRFAHAQFANAIEGEDSAGWRIGSWLNASGRVIAIFAIRWSGPDRIELAVPGSRGVEIADRLRRYVLRSRVSVAL